MQDSSKELLLTIAREAIIEELTGKISPTLARVAVQPPHDVSGDEGAFVTLKRSDLAADEPWSLRGCIVNIIGKRPLYRLIQRLACESAFHDPRFNAVRISELEHLFIEISVLSVPYRIESIDEIELGTHGVILRCNFHRAVFLPQVAPEQGWDVTQMLSHLSMKAGLPPDAYTRDDCSFQVFEALVFSEMD